jgi:Tfp pilus assembly protein PilF
MIDSEGILIRETGTRAVTKESASGVAADRLRALDRVLERDPEAYAARAERAGLLREQGRFEDAKRDYLELIRRKPNDFAALNDFGTLVLNAGYREAARSLFGEAVRQHPDNANGRVNLANLLFLLDEHGAAREHFDAALKIDPGHIHAHRGLANLLAACGDAAGAKAHRDEGFRNHAVTVLPYRGEGTPRSVLLLVAAAGGNIPTSALLDDRQFHTTVLVTEYADQNAALPPHDLVFNSIGDADLCGEALQAALALVARTTRPVINHPALVLETGRAANVERLRGLANVVVPRMVMLPKRLLLGSDAAAVLARSGLGFPLLVRAPGFHTGYHFAQVGAPPQLAAAVNDFPGDDVWLIEPLDARDSAGLFRKYRVMFVDGTLYPLHLAISRDWKVHYFTADMAGSAENRAKDEEFLNNMPGAIGPRAMAGLERIRATLNLDYGGIDFAVNARGDVLFFEANATMVVYPPQLDPKWAYRRAAVEAVLQAVRGMLIGRAAADRAA